MNANVATQTREDMIEKKIDIDFARNMEIASTSNGGSFVPKTLGEGMEFAKMMAISGPMVGKSFRNQPGACLGIAMQAWRWGMDPFAVSQKSYTTNESIAYEAQLVAAVIHTRAPIEGKPTYTYEGEGDDLICTVSVKLVGEDEPKTMVSPRCGNITPKNSPLWKTNPRQQLAYHTIRNWARLYVPEIIMGVYDAEEVEEMARAERARDVTPKKTSASVLDQFSSTEQPAPVVPINELVAKLKAALEEAPDKDELSAIWNVAMRDGEIARIREADEGQAQKLSVIYNYRSMAFDEDRNKAAAAAEAQGNEGAGDPEDPPMPTGEEEQRQQDDDSGKTNDAAGEAEMSDDEMEAATAYATFAIGQIKGFQNAKALGGWFNSTFLKEAKEKRLSIGQIERITDERDKQLKTFK